MTLYIACGAQCAGVFCSSALNMERERKQAPRLGGGDFAETAKYNRLGLGAVTRNTLPCKGQGKSLPLCLSGERSKFGKGSRTAGNPFQRVPIE